MKERLTAEFDNTYMADRAYGRLKSAGIPCGGIKTFKHSPKPQPGLFVSSPYPTQQHSYYNNQAFGLPQTTGTSIIMSTPMLDSFGEVGGKSKAVDLEVVVESNNLIAAKAILINSGGRRVRSAGRQ